MEQFCDYKMTDESSVVQQTHEIQSLSKELEYFKCVLPDKFVVGTIIAKLLPSWNDFATSPKTRDMSFLFWISLALLILRRRREQKTHVLGSLRELLVPTAQPAPKQKEQILGERHV